MLKELRLSYSIFIRHCFDSLEVSLEDTLGMIGNMSLTDHIRIAKDLVLFL